MTERSSRPPLEHAPLETIEPWSPTPTRLEQIRRDNAEHFESGAGFAYRRGMTTRIVYGAGR